MKNIVLIGLLAGFSCYGQTGSSRELTGTVSTSSGAPISRAQITANSHLDRTKYRATSDESGSWRVDLPEGEYDLQASATGFKTVYLKKVTAPGKTQFVLPATADDGDRVVYQPTVDSERTQQADSISIRETMELPVNRRTYTSLAALTPGVALVNDYVGITDAPLVQAPQSGLSFGGNNGRGNMFWLDGAENYINTGGVRPSISQEAIDEFHVDRSNYSAEFGGALGGIVNIVSRRGVQRFHGDVFGFLRDSRLDARNYFDLKKQADTRTQTGATLGGPLRGSKTFFFASFERLQRNNGQNIQLGGNSSSFGRLRDGQVQLTNFLDSTGDPSLRQLSGALRSQLLTTNFPGTLALFNSNSGVFPFSERFIVGSLRLDHQFSDNNNAFLRFNASSGHDENSQVEGLNGYSRGVIANTSDATLMLNDNYVISPRFVSESRVMLNRTRVNTFNRDAIGPSIDIAGYGSFGKDWTLPSDLHEWHGQLQQNFFYAAGRHSLRFGADINPVRDSTPVLTNSGGRFSFGEYLPLAALINLIGRNPNTAANIGALLAQSGAGTTLTGSLTTPLTAIQAFNLGIPAFYTQGFGDPNWSDWFSRYNFFLNDVFRVHPRLTLNAGIRYQLEAAPSILGTNRNNFAPRLGLAWSLTKDRKTVLRAGYGIYYLQDQAQLAAALEKNGGGSSYNVVVPLSGLPGSRNPATGQPVTSADIYQTLSAKGILGRRPIQASDLSQFGITPGPNFPYQVIFKKPVDFVHAYAEQGSLELERAFGDVSVSLAYNYNRGVHIPRLRDLNAAYGPPDSLGEPTLIPKDPNVAQLLTYESAANSYYNALIIQAVRRFRHRLTFNAHYTFSKSIDDTTDINFLPNDSLNARKEHALSTFDQRHRLVGSAVIDLPKGFLLAPIVTATSGRPFNVVTGVDYNSTRPAGAGRNIGLGPDFLTFDMRVSRSWRLRAKETAMVQLIVEGFNILNQTNFRRLNNTVGQVTVNDLPHPLVGKRGDIVDPLSFVSAFDPRQVQIALKVRW